MSDTPENATRSPHGADWKRKRSHRPISLEGLPTPEELASSPHAGEAADRFSMYTPEQQATETRTVRMDLTFEEVITIRDQWEMIAAAAQIILASTRKRDLGSIRQRIECRREAASLSKQLALMQGKTPRGIWKPKAKRSA